MATTTIYNRNQLAKLSQFAMSAAGPPKARIAFLGEQRSGRMATEAASVGAQFCNMKLHLQTPASNVVTGFGVGWFRIGMDEYRENVVLLPDTIVKGWAPEGFDALTERDFARLLDYEPEVLLLGTGATQRFPHPRLFAALSAAHVGVEVMDTGAACRTFNILVAEGRRVAAALIT